MKVLLLRDSRVNHLAGEIVEVSPDQANFLLSCGSAALADEVETPEKEQAVETPEKKRTRKTK